jgi:hypothetical protein
MSAMTTALTEFSDKENERTYVIDGASHTVSKKRMVLQRRKVPSGNQVIVEDEITVLYGTEDDNGDLLDQNVLFSARIRRPKQGIAADVTAALAVFRDIVAGDEFTATVNGSLYLS